jgi:hypothetical protein
MELPKFIIFTPIKTRVKKTNVTFDREEEQVHT